MAPDSSLPVSLSPEVVSQLACPACLGDLRLEVGRLVCAECGQAYPVVDGIPVLIAERGEKSNQSE
jgi:uncharacterized protein YbaR (Trm112 family)